jgi:tRNA(adenine34) deaminase
MENMNDIFYMQEAIKEAKKAYKIGEVPVGCVIVVNDEIVAKSHNLRHTFKNGLYHAEMIAISRACKKLSRWILDDATIYILR